MPRRHPVNARVFDDSWTRSSLMTATNGKNSSTKIRDCGQGCIRTLDASYYRICSHNHDFMLDTYIEVAAPVSDYAIIVNPDDNVAVVKTATFPGLTLSLPDGETVVVSAEIPPGHRFATRDIPASEF